MDIGLAQLNQVGLVLIHGPTGCGKTHLSHWLVERSRFAGRGFEVQEAAGLTEHRFESQLFGHVKGAFTGAVQAFPGLLGLTGDGVLLLEGVEDLSLDGQARLLRFLETKRFRTVGHTEERVFSGGLILTSGSSPKTLMDQGRFRQDFYYRIAGAVIGWPPTSARPRDFERVFHDLGVSVAQALGKSENGLLTAKNLENCRGREFPGGYHQLRNLLYRAAILGVSTAEIDVEVQAGQVGELPQTGSLKSDLSVLEKRLIERGLRAFPHSRKELADHLGISVRTLMYKLKLYDLH